ncbi:hypothetical protein LTS15_006874 [Exophiala xenobiotica]|nr:hypothetical protein LTS15_006874 [Exophiala xenobiotica]
MGCGHSSLKGADVPNLNSQPVEINRPMKKVATNFSDVNYDQDPQQQRRLTEYGPDETPRQHPPSQQPQGGGMLAPSLGQGNYDPMGAASPGFGSGIGAGAGVGAPGDVGYAHQGRGLDRSDPNPNSNPNMNRPGFNNDPNDAGNGIALKPYQTTDAGDWDDNNDNYQSQGGGRYQDQGAQDYQGSSNLTQNQNQNSNNYNPDVPNHQYPHGSSSAGAGAGTVGSGYTGDRDPTSSQAKDDFAHVNDPANPMNQEGYRYEGGGQNHQHQHQQLHGYDDDNDDGNENENMDYPSGGGDYHDNDGYGKENADNDNDNENRNRRSPSWLGQRYASYQAAKQGRGVSDDDLKKYTGKDRAEFDEWAAQQPGVAGRQLAMDPQSAAGGSYVAS